MPEVTAVFADDRTVRIDRPDAVWFLRGVTGVEPTAIDRLADSGNGESFCGTHGDALIVRITSGSRPSVTAWKALFSSHELFWTVRPAGDIVVADHYRNIMAALPVSERAPSDLTLAAHHLTRKPHGSLTMAAGVERHEYGTRLDIDATSGTWTKVRFARVPDQASERPRDEYLAAVDTALRESFDQIGDDDAALLFSGGVDSTLLLAIDPAITPVTFVPDTLEFAEETVYARSAAAQLGVDLHELTSAEDMFVERLERSIDATGIPVFDDSTAYFHQVFEETPYRAYVSGLGADSAFGSSLKLARLSNAFRFTPSRQILRTVAPVAPGHLGYRFGQVSSRANGFATDPWDPDGWAGNTRSYGDSALIDAGFGAGMARQVKERQFAYVDALVDNVGTADNSFFAHLDIHHWMTVFGGPFYETRLHTIGLGKQSVGPYGDWRVLDALASIPLTERYVIGLRAKWILKDLLAARVPDYPINQRKKATALPWQRFYTDGPLVGIFDRYPLPEVWDADPDLRRQVTEHPSPATWTSIMHAMWHQRIQTNPDLTPIGVVETYSVTFGGDGGTASGAGATGGES